jgi:nucleoside-diphosphate-sugar epimerase
MTRCLLLGASGFLGRQVRDRLATQDRVELIAVDRRSPAAGVGLDLTTAGSGAVAGLLRATGATVVVNCAGATGADPLRLVADNVVAVATLLAGIDRLARPIRLVHIGSAAEYGPVAAGRPVSEAAAARPSSPYGVSKLAGTALVLAAAAHGLAATVLRLFNLVGPGTPPPLLPGRLVAELQAARATGGPARVGSLDGHRDFVDVRDAAAAIAAAAGIGDLPRLLNIGSGRAVRLRELAAEVVDAAGGGRIAESEPGSSRSDGVRWLCADITAARTALCWQPAICLRASVRDMWRAAGTVAPVAGP